jgi:predicted dehydrogenase
MRALIHDRWVGEFLDAARGADEYRIDVRAWRVLAAVEGLYFVRSPDPRVLWNYLGEVGPRAVWQKIRSRWAERDRNQKFIACGFGEVLEGPADGLPAGTLVVFLAPKHPQCVDRCVLPRELVTPVAAVAESSSFGMPPQLAASATVLCCTDPLEAQPHWLSVLAGWDAASGDVVDAQLAHSVLIDCRQLLRDTDWTQVCRLPRSTTPPRESDRAESSELKVESLKASLSDSQPLTLNPQLANTRPTAALFGYGNYAKTVILPNVRAHLDVISIHELDPLQLGRTPFANVNRDTSGTLRPGEHYDALLIAGYHHAHAPLAVAALQQGAAAIVEKPVATTPEQLSQLLAALERISGRLYECFQRRYSRLNDFARADLAVSPGEPIDYHAIVYEVPLPERHWYRWPNSRTRLTSNGCHWIDHFLFLNDFSEPRDLHVTIGPREIANVSIALTNGAFFTMTLTDAGSERIGVQDHVELRANGRTAFIENNARYRAEGRYGILRRRSISRQESYARMYREIARQVAAGEEIDARRSLRISAGTVLALEEQMAAVRKHLSQRPRTAA